MADNNEISVLVMAIERLSENQNQTNEKVDKLIESMGKQEVILEKLANIEKTHADNNKRIHKRIDAVEENISLIIKKQQTTGCYALNTLNKDYEKVKDKVLTIERKPLQAIGLVVKGLLLAIGTGLAGYIFIKSK